MSDSKQPMILQQCGFLVPKTFGDVVPLLLCEHHAVEALVDDMVVMEGACVLR